MTNMVTPRCRPLGDPWRLKHNGHPSVPVVADGAKDVAAAPMVVTPRAAYGNGNGSTMSSGFARGSLRPTHGSPRAGPGPLLPRRLSPYSPAHIMSIPFQRFGRRRLTPGHGSNNIPVPNPHVGEQNDRP